MTWGAVEGGRKLISRNGEDRKEGRGFGLHGEAVVLLWGCSGWRNSGL